MKKVFLICLQFFITLQLFSLSISELDFEKLRIPQLMTNSYLDAYKTEYGSYENVIYNTQINFTFLDGQKMVKLLILKNRLKTKVFQI